MLDGPAGGTVTAIGGRFDRVEEIIGDSDFAAQNALRGFDAANVFNFTAPNTGNIDGTFFFRDFGAVTSGTGSNGFVFANGAIPSSPLVGSGELHARPLRLGPATCAGTSPATTRARW